jgi:hypothetical protein
MYKRKLERPVQGNNNLDQKVIMEGYKTPITRKFKLSTSMERT